MNIMQPLEQMLSPMVKIREGAATKTLNKNDLALLEMIKEQKIDIVHQRTNPSHIELVRPEVNESWIRSHKYGLALFDYNYGPILDRPAFEKLVRENDLLLKAADPYIGQLETILSSSDCTILLSDEQGVMLRVVEGGRDLSVQQNRRFHLEPGVIWTEKTIGTCAHGISLITGNPMQICGPEHYSESFQQISCSSAPIFDVNNNLIGNLSIVTPSFHQQSPYLFSLVISMAWAIQNAFQLALNKELLSDTLEPADEAVITINKSGILAKVNTAAMKMFNYLGIDLRGMHIEDVLGKQPLIKSVLDTGKPVFDIDIEIDRWNQRLHLRSAQPVKDHHGGNFGCVLILKKNDRERKIGSQVSGGEAKFTFDKIVGSSPRLEKSINMARKFSRLDANILIQGESGSGKEVFAQAIHNESRPDGPFIAVNCAAIPRTLIESELFGYEGGAFTGAERQGRRGKIELANRGTLFLDEIGDMPLELQPVLLRVLEEKKVMRVGGSKYLPIDFRLVTATNKNLLELVNNGQFREDLYYRLKVLKICIPALRERSSDIIRLAKYFIDTIAKKQQILAPSLSEAAMYWLLRYNWPGNIRQLENAVLYAINISSDGVIKPEDLPEEISGLAVTPSQDRSSAKFEFIPDNKITELNLSLKEMEKTIIIQALLQTGNNMCKAAELLGTSRSTIYRKVKEFNLLNEIRIKK